MNVHLKNTDAVGPSVTLACLTSLMDLSTRLATHASDVMETDGYKGMALLDDADLLAEKIGVLAERTGHSIEDVTGPLWVK